MIHLVSKSDTKAEVVVTLPDNKRETLHLRYQPIYRKWTDKWGTEYNLTQGTVDFFLFYRDRLSKYSVRSAHLLSSEQVNEMVSLVKKMAHELHRNYPEYGDTRTEPLTTSGISGG